MFSCNGNNFNTLVKNQRFAARTKEQRNRPFDCSNSNKSQQKRKTLTQVYRAREEKKRMEEEAAAEAQYPKFVVDRNTNAITVIEAPEGEAPQAHLPKQRCTRCCRYFEPTIESVDVIDVVVSEFTVMPQTTDDDQGSMYPTLPSLDKAPAPPVLATPSPAVKTSPDVCVYHKGRFKQKVAYSRHSYSRWSCCQQLDRKAEGCCRDYAGHKAEFKPSPAVSAVPPTTAKTTPSSVIPRPPFSSNPTAPPQQAAQFQRHPSQPQPHSYGPAPVVGDPRLSIDISPTYSVVGAAAHSAPAAAANGAAYMDPDYCRMLQQRQLQQSYGYGMSRAE